MSTILIEHLHTTEFSSNTVFLYTPENSSASEFMSTTEFTSTESIIQILQKPNLTHGLLNRWMSQLDLGITTEGLEKVVSVHYST